MQFHNCVYFRGAKIDQPDIYGNSPIHFAVTNDISEAILWFHQTNRSSLQIIHPGHHMSLAHYAVYEKSYMVLRALHSCQPHLINQTITEG